MNTFHYKSNKIISESDHFNIIFNKSVKRFKSKHLVSFSHYMFFMKMQLYTKNIIVTMYKIINKTYTIITKFNFRLEYSARGITYKLTLRIQFSHFIVNC